MKLHRLALTNYRGVDQRVVTFPESGVIVLQGPNEIGKTSMVEALDLLLDEKDSSRKRQVEAVRPVGRDVPTAIEAEISSGPYRFTYRKQWFRKPATELRVAAPRVEQHAGVAAHDRVRAILEETADTDLWRALRLMQATPLAQEDLSGSSALGDALDRAAGQAEAAGPVGETVLEAVEAEYGRYFTPRAGAPTGPYKALEREVANAGAAAAAALAAVEGVQQDADACGRAEEELARCAAELARAAANRDSLEAQGERIAEVEVRIEAARTAALLAGAEFERARQRQEDRRRQVGDVEACTSECAALAEELAAVEATLGTHLQDAEELQGVQQAAEAEELRARAASDLAARDRAHLGEVAARGALELRLREIDEAGARRVAAEGRLGALAVDRALWGRIEQADRALETARLEQRAASARLAVTALADGQVIEIDGARRELRAGDVVEPPLGEALDIVVPGALRFVFRPEAGAAARAEAVVVAEAALAALLREAGAADVAEARAQHEARDAAEADLREATAAERLLLRGEDVTALRAQWQAAIASTTTYLGLRPDTSPLPSDPACAEAAAAETWLAHERAREAAAEARRVHEVARTRVEGLTQRLTDLSARNAAAAARLGGLRAALEGCRASRPDGALEAAVGEAAVALDRARAAEAALRRQLSELDADAVRAALHDARAAVVEWEQRRAAQAEVRAAVRGRLEKVDGEGLQEASDSAQTALEHAQREFAATERRARAVRLLRETLLAHRAAAQQAYASPFADAVNRLGRVVYGDGFQVEVDDQLRVVARVLDGRSVPFESLSTGAKEQLAVLTRLACAGLVDGDQGVPVVIDDALGYSDPQRLRRICDAFNGLETASQVILLTCTPGRYAGIEGAEFVTLS